MISADDCVPDVPLSAPAVGLAALVNLADEGMAQRVAIENGDTHLSDSVIRPDLSCHRFWPSLTMRRPDSLSRSGLQLPSG